MTSTTKLGVVITASDQASSDLARVAQEFVRTGGVAAEMNKEVSDLEKRTMAEVERARIKAFAQAESARGADFTNIKAMYDKAVQVAIESDGEAAKSAARTAKLIEREWLSAINKVETERIKAAEAAAKAEAEAAAKRKQAAAAHDDSAVAASTTLFGKLRSAIGLTNTEASQLAPLTGFGGAVAKLGPVGMAAGTALKYTAAAVTAVVVAGAAAGAGLLHLAEDTASAVNQQRLLAARATTSIETLSRFGYAASSVGADLEDAQDALSELGQRAVNMPKDFERWGIATTNANGTLKTTRELLFSVADRIQQTSSQTERLALADELMSDVGRRLLPVLEGGAAGLEAMFQESDRLGNTIEGTSAVIAERFVRQLRETETATNAVSRVVGGAFQPAATEAFSAVENVARRVLERVTENEEAFTDFATGAVALLARGFALLVETGSALSHVAEGIVSIFTFRLGPAFDQARALAADVAQEARFLAGDLERGAEVTRNEVVPAVDSERASRAELVKVLGNEKQKRKELQELQDHAEDAAFNLEAARVRALKLGDSEREDLTLHAETIRRQVAELAALQGKLKGTKTDATAMAQAIARINKEAASFAEDVPADELEAWRKQEVAAATAAIEAETEAKRTGIKKQIAVALENLKANVAAAEESVKAEEDAADAKIEADRRVAAAQRETLQRRRKLYQDQAREETENRTEATRAAAEQWNSYVRNFEQAGQVVVGSLRQAFEGVRSGSMSAGDAALSVLESVGNAALNAALSYSIQQAAIAATNALLGTQAATAAATTASQVSGAATASTAQTTGAVVATGATKVAAFSAITAAAARAGAEAFAAYVGIPFVGPALGTAAAAEAVGQTMAFASLLAFNKGGLVPGVGNTDSVPAWLTPGELVVPKEVTQALMGAGAAGGPPTALVQPQMMLPTSQADFDRMVRDGLGPALARAGWRKA